MKFLNFINYDKNELNKLENNVLTFLNKNQKLKDLNNEDLNDICLKIKFDDIKDYIHDYVRIPIKVNDDFDIYILIWKNCITKIHNHAKNGCVMKILEGNLIENRFDKQLNKISTKKLNKNNISYIDDNIGYHNIQNINGISVSLHIYSPPNFVTSYFD